MVDLHSHVLFDIDDGAETIEDSLAILERAKRKGITKMMATPHFTLGEDVDEFIKMRDRRLEELKEEAEEVGIELKAGAEVYITDELFNEDKLNRLTLGDSDVILAEFRYHGLRAEDFIEYIDKILESGLRVLVAHPERYSYLIHNKVLVDALLDRGVMLQINAISLFSDTDEGDFARAAVRCGIAEVIGSDIHHAASRRLLAMGKLWEDDDENLRMMLHDNPDKIFKGKSW